ncbi:rhomboid family intramembrane serine protease [Hufsiella ginkgonis]|uniref:Rhomboid family intramembrane serine protease n=1 Tax=Hufsiella ginkgonis TaxID=2695274 RepID=A0A7K1XVN6_9SPHI|nr:rhomboid family intramembrane serine protease [Hufsiella ginkgonis]MXV14877.1 rhomboid family intramembrane serine protease [Hufsiella ginkgonis]
MEQYLTETPVASFIFLVTIATSLYAFYNDEIYHKFMLNPYSVSRNERVYSIITSGLIHLDMMHLVFNMIAFTFAFPLELELGHWQFGALYIASLALSDIGTIVKHKDNYGYNSLGASGAVSAVIFSYILFAPKTGIGLIFLPGINIPGYIFGPLYLVYSAYAANKESRINHDAHFYGAVAGIIITIMFQPGVVPHFLNEVGLTS